MKTIYWAGDSTVKQNTILTFPQTGIGQVFHLFVRPDVRIENHAENGRSTKSFLDEGRLAVLYDRIGPGDFLFVQFGHNDEKISDPNRYTDPDGEFADNLERFANAARNKGGLPVFITPLTRRGFREPGAELSHGAYAASMRRRAARLGVPLVDLCARSEELVSSLYQESAAYYMHVPAGKYPRYPDGAADDTHLRYPGAVAFGRLIADGLYALGGEYAALLTDGYGELLGGEGDYAKR